MENNNNNKIFHKFSDTYRYCSISLAISLTFPNEHNVKKRFFFFVLLVMFNLPMLIWFLIYTLNCMLTLDLYNTSRSITVALIVVLYITKFFYSLYKTSLFSRLIKRLSDNLIHGNDMNEDCKQIYAAYVKQGKITEIIWILIPLLLTAQFAVYAAILNIYITMVHPEQEKAMVLEMELLGLEDKQNDSPYFEIIFTYCTVDSLLLVFNFVGFDGSFCIVTTHLRLMLKVLEYKMHSTFNNAKDKFDLRERLKEGIKSHQELLLFYNDIQEVYGGWLFIVFATTSILISFNLYLIYLAKRMEPKYVIFAISGAFHMFAPSYYSNLLAKASEEFAVELYCVNWEKWGDTISTKMLIMMITRAQKPMQLTGMGIICFDMQLFISVMQFSYSFFTLITS